MNIQTFINTLCDLYVQLYEPGIFFCGFSLYALRVDTYNNFATLIFLHLSLHMIVFKDNSAHLQVIPNQYCAHVYHVTLTKYELKEKQPPICLFLCICLTINGIP